MSISVAPYRPGDVVRYRRAPQSPHGIGVISAMGTRDDDYDTVIYSIYTGGAFASMLHAEHLELLLHPAAQIRRRYSYRAIFDLTIGPERVASNEWNMLHDAWRLWNRLDRCLRHYTGLEHRYEQDAARRERISKIQQLAELRVLRRLDQYNQIVETTIPRML